MTLKKLYVNGDLMSYAKITLKDQLKMVLIDKIPLWALPPRQNKLIIIDKKGELTEIDF